MSNLRNMIRGIPRKPFYKVGESVHLEYLRAHTCDSVRQWLTEHWYDASDPELTGLYADIEAAINKAAR